jgi:glyoxylase-like metal-dependent hydrolase (beta-lactamase superfamily II)
VAATPIVPGVYAIPVGPVNTFLLEGSDGCTLIDPGFPGSAAKILDAVRGLGKQDKDIRHIVLTHAHPDHIGTSPNHPIVRERNVNRTPRLVFKDFWQ